MELAAVLASVPYGMLFSLVGFTVNIIQAACFLFIWPLSRITYRRIIGVVTEVFWLLIIWLMDCRACVEVHLHTDLKTYQLMGKESAVVMPNHMCDADVHLMWLLAQRSGCLRSALTVVKKSTMYLPVYGWAMWFSENVFLDRSWSKDEKVLRSSFEGLRDFPRPFWLTIFVEGTRMTPDKLLAAQNFAHSRGLPVPRNVLIPRTKGFVSAVKYMRSFVPAIYDVTVAVPEGHPIPSLLRFLKGQHCVIHVHIKRYPMKELPESDEAIAQWCRDKFLAKDDMLDKFQAKGTFEGERIANFRRSKKSLIVFGILACIFSAGAIILIRRYSLLSTWEGVASLAAGLALDVIMMHVFIEYTKLPKQAVNADGPSKLM